MLLDFFYLSGTYGIPLPWYFPITKSYWCGSMNDKVLGVEIEPNDAC